MCLRVHVYFHAFLEEFQSFGSSLTIFKCDFWGDSFVVVCLSPMNVHLLKKLPFLPFGFVPLLRLRRLRPHGFISGAFFLVSILLLWVGYPDEKQRLGGKLFFIELWEGGSYTLRLPSPGRYSAAGEYGPSGWIQRKEMSFSAPRGASFMTDDSVEQGLHPSDGFSSL